MIDGAFLQAIKQVSQMPGKFATRLLLPKHEPRCKPVVDDNGTLFLSYLHDEEMRKRG